MNIRQAKVRQGYVAAPADLLIDRAESCQADDLMGMQACNLQNLPENYTMKYCRYHMSSDVGGEERGRRLIYVCLV